MAHLKSLQIGEFLEAEFFENMAEKANGDEGEIKLMRLERFVMQKHLKLGFELGNSLVKFFAEKGLVHKQCMASIFLSQIYYYSKDYFRALLDLNKCLDIAAEFNYLEIPVKLALAETCLLAFESPLICANVLNSLENKIFNRNSRFLLGKFYKLKAKVSLFLSSKIEEGLDGDVIKKALEYLELAEEELVNDGCL